MSLIPGQKVSIIPINLAAIGLIVLWPALAGASPDLSSGSRLFNPYLPEEFSFQPKDYFSFVLEAPGLFLGPGSEQNRFLRVLRVIDGDNLEVEGVGEVRLIGVDSPELYHPLKPVQYYAREASEFVRKLLEQSRVRLEFDQEKYDKYGRTLAYVYLEDGRSLNEEIIKNGYGFALLRFPFKHLVRYKQLEARAREEGLGLWRHQGLDEFNWILKQKTTPYEIFEMANNWWAVRYKEFVKLRLTPEEVQQELLNLRQWTNEFSPTDLEKTLLNNGWLKMGK
ncbi:MAG: thermonuclease family protein [Candidatus Aminicenantes bacterium]|nr:thermonuclease family protein [Candidatus Aminicenantes bacterium]